MGESVDDFDQIDVNGIENNATYNGTNKTCENTWNEYCENMEQYVDRINAFLEPNPFEWVMIIIFIMVFVIGIVGNFLVCVSVYRNHHLRTVTNFFIVNLAIADFLVILFCLPPSLLEDVRLTWYMGEAMCKFIKYLQRVSVTVSVLTLSAISVERWYAICYPLKFVSSASRARTAIIIIWFIAFIINIHEIIILGTVPLPNFVATGNPLMTKCVPTYGDFLQYQNIISGVYMILLFWFPFIVMGFCYLSIAKQLWINAIPGVTQGQSCDVAASQLRSRRKAAQMLIVVVIMFFYCYLPTHIIDILKYAGIKLPTDYIGEIGLSVHFLIYLNSSINPVIYNFMSAKFRREFKFAFSCCLRPCMDKRAHYNGDTTRRKTVQRTGAIRKSSNPKDTFNSNITQVLRYQKIRNANEELQQQSTI